MENLRFSLVCFETAADQVCGVLLGTAFSGIERSVQKVKAAASDWLKRQWDDDPDALQPDLFDPQLRRFAVPLQLAYPSPKGPYPLPNATVLEVEAVYGAVPATGAWRCYLPWLEVTFFYYQPEQLPDLVAHFTRQRLEGRPPEEVAPYLTPGRVWLEELLLRHQRPDRTTPRPSPALQRLAHLADRLPGPRSLQRLFPEAPWERAAEVEQVVQLWTGPRCQVLLVGAAGAGKTVVLQEAIRKVQALTRGRRPAPTFWRSSARRLLAQARYLGEWQEICDQLIDDLEAEHGILWLNDLPELLRTGGEGAEDSLAAYLLTALRQGRMQLVGEVTERELAAMRRQLPAFAELFRVVPIAELDPLACGRVIQQLGQYAAQHLAVNPTPRALDLSYRLLARHVRYECFPGKAARFLTACVRRARADSADVLDESAVLAEFSRQTGFPELLLRDEIPLAPAELQTFFGSRVIGQPDAVANLCGLVATFKAGLNDPARPIATLLFTGPTGVGKTAAALALAEFFFGAGATRSPLFRLDMSEFQYAGQLHRLLGDDRRPSTLVQHVRDRPFSVILFDEIEKADPLIFDALLTTLDEGLLTDARGRTTDFRSAVIILTTNLGARYGTAPGFLAGDAQTGDRDIRQHFRPEFFNRIDRVVRFQALDRDAMALIANRELAALASRSGFAKRGLRLQFHPSCAEHIATAGYHPRYGARPLQRAIERDIVAPLARLLLQQPRKNQMLHLSYDSTGLVVEAS